jgi:S-adenosylmethionine synthetase
LNLQIDLLSGVPPSGQPLEIVERKGFGHPDSICDELAELLSQKLSRYYHEQFGLILHHNLDKGLLFGGRAAPAFRGGEVVEPMEIFLAGRVTTSFEGRRVDCEEIAIAACKEWFRQNFHALDPDRHLKIRPLFREGSRELTELYRRYAETGVALANDTSCGVGYAPLDELEKIVLGVERKLNDQALRHESPAIGQDIKIMGVRAANTIHLTVACAMIDSHLRGMDDYLRYRHLLGEWSLDLAGELTSLPVKVVVNGADNFETGSVYLTVTGTSGEGGDDGEVGRGNRANGLITPCRPMSMEALAGKNPVSHVGKIYNLLAGRLAGRLVEQMEEVSEAYCYMVSQIGKPVGEPQQVEVRLRLADGAVLNQLQRRVFDLTAQALEEAKGLWREVLAGELKVLG